MNDLSGTILGENPINENAAVYLAPTALGHCAFKGGRNVMQDNHTPKPPQEQETFVSKSANELKAKLQEIEDLKAWLQQAKDDLPQMVFALLESAPTKDEADALSWEVYWRLQEIPTTPLSDFYRMPIYYVRQIIGAASAEVKCKSCGKKQRHNFDSRTAYKAGLSGFECDECVEKRNQQNEQWKAQHRQKLAEQEQLLHELKTMPYRQYLETDHWKTMRMDMLKRAKFACQLCSAKGQLHVHHRTYERRGEENYSDLIVLCANCHGKFHDKLAVQP